MKLCMGCMNQIEEHLSACPYCGFDEANLRQESYYLDPGTVVGGKYIVGRVLSYGGHTVSYLGMDAEHNLKVIVKEYLPSDFSTRSEGETDVTIYSGDGQEQFEQGLANFLNEANRIQCLGRTEGIARVYDCVTENETGYVISEYVEGVTLKEILDGGKKYSAEEAAAFVKKILSGLSGVHRLDIVHCDISPETIMVTAAGEIKLTDFGATRYVTTANSKSLSIILKRGYAPEEQYRSRGQRGPWTDVYALGAVMYRMITGAVPQESVDRALADDLKEPSKLGIAIPKNIEHALMNALNVYQHERTPSAEAFLEELNSDTVKRIKVKQRKKGMGKFPLWAKGLVAGLALAVAAGGGYVIYHMQRSSADMIDSNAVAMQDFHGKPEEELRQFIEKLNEEHEWNLQIQEEDTVFDLNFENGDIYSQSISSGTVLYDPDAEEQQEIAGLTYDEEGRLSGTILVRLYSRDTVHYDEICDLNAYQLAKKLKIPTKESASFVKQEKTEESGEDTKYFDLAYAMIGGKKYTSKDLKEPGNEKEVIKLDGDIEIHYYATKFAYWKKLPDFTSYGSLDDIPVQPVYQYASEDKRSQVGEEKISDLVGIDDSLWAVQSDNAYKGKVVGQSIPAGQEYDGSNPGDTQLELQVLGNVFEYKGKTGKEFVATYLEPNNFGAYGYMYESGEYADGSTEILRVEVYESDGYRGMNEDKKVDTFRYNPGNDDTVYFKIVVADKPAEKPPANTSSGGGTSGGSLPRVDGNGREDY